MDFTLPRNTIFYELERTIKLYRKLSQDHIDQTGYDVSVNQLILLIQIVKNPKLTQVELSEVIFKDFASIARMVDLLVKKDFLKRTENPKDRRKKDLIPTPKGIKMVNELVPVINNYRALALKGIDPDEVAKTLKLLETLADNCITNFKD
ncbi:MAG: hypothetical protein Sapg2KO_41630 [Saprospiraceae bacterium]